jgi:hypothetical protein
MTDVSRDLHIQGEAARALLLNIKDVVEDDAEMIETAIEGETNLKEAISAAVDRILELDAHEEAITAQIKALSERKERFAHQSERIKAAIHVAMSQAELRKIELPQATLGVRAVPPKCEITDEAEIPSRFWKPQDPKLDKKAVLDALKGKEEVPGAVLSNGGETLSIGRK